MSGTPMTSSLRAGPPTGNVIPAADFLATPSRFARDILVLSLQTAIDMDLVPLGKDKGRLHHPPPSQLSTMTFILTG